jgi:hypothetical protein
MTVHVPEPALLDVLEGGGARSDRAHVAACPTCAARLAEAGEGWALARGAEVPEPLPFYWASLRRAAGRRVEAAPPRRIRWAVILPLSILAAAGAAALSIGPASRPSIAPSNVVPAWSALPPEDADESLPVLRGLALAGGDLAAWGDSQGIGPFLAGLSDEDSRALVTSLRTSGARRRRMPTAKRPSRWSMPTS